MKFLLDVGNGVVKVESSNADVRDVINSWRLFQNEMSVFTRIKHIPSELFRKVGVDVMNRSPIDHALVVMSIVRVYSGKNIAYKVSLATSKDNHEVVEV